MSAAHEYTAKTTCQTIADALASAGLPRTSTLSGGEVRGLTQSLGSTGFSVRKPTGEAWDRLGADELDFHVVVSGKPAGVRYERTFDSHSGEELSEPRAADTARVAVKVAAVFEALGFTVVSSLCTGWQTAWDDDVDFNVIVKAGELLV